MDRVELIIALSGDKQALSSLKSLENAVESLKSKKLDIKIEKTDIDKQIRALQQNIRNTRLDIKMELIGAEEGEKRIEGMQSALSTLQNLSRLLGDEMRDVSNAIESAKEETKNFGEELNPVASKIDEIADGAERIGNFFSMLSSASGAIGDFAGGIGDAFSGMAGIFDLNFIDNIEKSLTYLGTKAVTGNLDRVTSRYDILKTFTDYLEITGVTADEANEALQRINDSILGLPIGLDESAYRLRRYQMLLGDINQATNLTIGLQRAVIAGGASEHMRTQAYYQIDRLLATGKLTQARQWFSLINGLGVSISFLAEEMGFGGMAANEAAAALVAGLSSGEIPVRDFLGALESLGEGTSTAAQKLDRALEIYKGTIESWLSNINFAMIRGGANVLDALNQSLLAGTDLSIVGYMKELRDGLNEMYKAAGSWITSNPQAFADTIASFRLLLESVSGINFGQVAGGVLENIGRMFEMISGALNRIPDGKLESFISFATTLAGPIGKLFSAVQSGLPQMLAVFERFENFNFESLTSRIFDEVERLANVYAGILNIIPDSVMTELLTFGLVYAKPLASGFAAIAGALSNFATGLRAISGNWNGSIFAQISAFAVAHPAITAVAGAVSALALAVGGLFIADRAHKLDIYEQLGLADTERIIASADRVTTAFKDMSAAYDETVISIDQKVGFGQKLADEVVQINEALSNAGSAEEFNDGFTDLASAVRRLNDLFPDLNIEIDETTGLLTEQSSAVLADSEAWFEMARATEQASAAMEYISQLDLQNIQQQTSLEVLRQQLADTNDEIERLRKITPDFTGQEFPEDYYDNQEKIKQYTETQRKLTAQIAETEAAQETLNAEMKAAEEIAKGAQSAEAEYAETATAATEKVKTSIEGLTKAYTDLREESDKTIQKQIEGFGNLEQAAATSLSEVASGLESDTEVLRNYNKDMQDILTYLTENRGNLDSQTYNLASWFAAEGLDSANLVAGFAEAIRNADETAITEAVEAFYERSTEAAKAADASGFIQAIAQNQEEFINNMTVDDFGTLEHFGDTMIEALTASVEESLASGDAAGNVMNALGNALFNEENVAALKEMATANLGEGGLLGMLGLGEEQIQADLEGLAALQEGILAASETMGLALNGEEESLGGAFSAINDWIIVLVDESVPLFMETVAMVQEAIIAFYEGAVEGLRAKLQETEEQTTLLETALIKLTNTTTAKTPVVDAFTSTMDRLRSMLREAESAVIALREAINSLEDKTVTVTYVENHVGGFSGGGMVQYRAGGGTIFQPRGTDTVPAMLTPGEFVMRRKAVEKLGAPFFNMLNRLDVSSAIDALMSRVAMPTAGSYISYDNRRTYDNHATVNQKIYTNNPSYTYRRASRWANAL